MALVEWAQARGVALASATHGACSITLAPSSPAASPFKAPEATAEDLYATYGGKLYEHIVKTDHGLDEEYQPVVST